MQTILNDYKIGAVCVEHVKGQLYAVGIFANSKYNQKSKDYFF